MKQHSNEPLQYYLSILFCLCCISCLFYPVASCRQCLKRQVWVIGQEATYNGNHPFLGDGNNVQAFPLVHVCRLIHALGRNMKYLHDTWTGSNHWRQQSSDSIYPICSNQWSPPQSSNKRRKSLRQLFCLCWVSVVWRVLMVHPRWLTASISIPSVSVRHSNEPQ